MSNQFTLRLTYKTLVSKFLRKIFFLTVQTIQISIISFKRYENAVTSGISCMQIETSCRAIFPAQSRGLTLSNGNTTTREINRALVYPSKRSQRAAAAAVATAAAAAARKLFFRPQQQWPWITRYSSCGSRASRTALGPWL